MATTGDETAQPETFPKLPVPDNSNRELLARVDARVLYGWMAQEEVRQMLAGHVDAVEEARRLQEHSQMVQAIQNRPDYKPESPIAESNGWDLGALSEREDLKDMFAPHQWEPAVIDLRKILAFQKYVRLPGLRDRVNDVEMDKEAVTEACLPTKEQDTPVVWQSDSDGKGLTIASFNPNFRVLGAMPGTANIQPDPNTPAAQRPAIFVTYGAPPSYLQVAEFEGRYFLRDGYHRAIGLIRKDIHEVPCVLIKARSAAEVYPAAGNFFSPDVMKGPKPPLLVDFLDGGVSADGPIMEVRKIIRVRGDEFVIPS